MTCHRRHIRPHTSWYCPSQLVAVLQPAAAVHASVMLLAVHAGMDAQLRASLRNIEAEPNLGDATKPAES
jgi:hypothetical protein